MVQLIIKNIKEVDELLRSEILDMANKKVEYFNSLFKNYNKEMKMELIFNHTSSVNTVSISLNMKSKKLLLVKEGKDLIKLVRELFADFRKMVNKQYELERKDYEYKRKR